MNKVFISGKITGEPVAACFNKFEAAENALRAQGFNEVINPMKIDGILFDIDWRTAMEICLKELAACTHIFMLSDWKNSKGATMEHGFAQKNNIKVMKEADEQIGDNVPSIAEGGN